MTAPLVIIGDSLLDRDVDGSVERVAPDAPVPVVDQDAVISRPGGAGLAAVLAARDGRDVILITAFADDDAARELDDLLQRAGVHTVDLGTDAPTPEKVRIAPGGRPLIRLDRGGRRPGRVGDLTPAAADALAGAAAILVSDYGRGVTAVDSVRDAVLQGARAIPVVWDPHPRGGVPVAGVRVATPNRDEVGRFCGGLGGDDLHSITTAARTLIARWQVAGLAVTLGRRGALFVDGEAHPLTVPVPAVDGGDPCGAGDRFAVTVASRLADGAVPSEAVVDAANASTVFVAAGGAATVHTEPRLPGRRRPRDARALVDEVRASGGSVVATGGCFDLLHAGHVATLEGARSLGDCLVVCINSDASVRRLKGPGRPVMPADDREALLLALGCVDAVAVFDEDTPEAVLERLRPDIWAKGADYATTDLPEARVVERWGGQAVVLPYLRGRSTSRLVEEVRNGE
ncbi:MAG: D-glycero-beta-D-manno-heptose 1-phosphate adenylyltransferase [Actinobacteria bacterium]|nr:D-glycero-beta-D-manno-heptose 1-phosphate adenylyltransferase [Actinomycetota bacterium]